MELKELRLLSFAEGNRRAHAAQEQAERLHRWWPAAPALLAAAGECQGHPEPMLRALAEHHEAPPVPGEGSTSQLWELLASVAAIDLVAARTLEPHLDAAGILQQTGIRWTGGTWGVFAAEGAGLRLQATGSTGGSWILNGTKPWCSLASQLSHALVSAHAGAGRRLFAVALDAPGVQPQEGGWISRGMAQLPSSPVDFKAVPAVAIGASNWYLDRPGFAIGAVGVAACWHGGAAGIFRHLLHGALTREPDQLALAWLGEADRLLAGNSAQLARAAALADAGQLDARQANQVRGIIAANCTRMLQLSAEATGPGPLATNEEHARRVADLGIYLRQHHGARDDAALGHMVLDAAQESGMTW